MLLLTFHFTVKTLIIGRQTDDQTADMARDNFWTEEAIGFLLQNHLTIFISVSGKKLMRKKSKEDEQNLEE